MGPLSLITLVVFSASTLGVAHAAGHHHSLSSAHTGIPRFNQHSTRTKAISTVFITVTNIDPVTSFVPGPASTLTVTATVTVTASANGCPSSSPVFSSSTFSAATLSSSSTLSSSPAPASSSSSSVTSASSAAPTILQDPATTAGEYDLNGCYIDPADIGYPLVAPFQAADITTVQQCADECADPANGGPYTYAGIEGVQCFCSNATATAPQTPDDCTLPCLGDSTVVCAGDQVVGPSTLRRRGGAGIVVYQLNSVASTSTSTSLTTSLSSSSTTSSSSALSITPSTSLPSASFSSTSLPSSSATITPSQSPPSSSQGLGTSSTSSSTQPASTSTSSAPVATWSGTPAIGTTINGLEYLGCVAETTPRTLSLASYTDPNGMTIESCAAFCYAQNWGLAAVEYSQECYCGDALMNGGVVGASGCTMPCKGDSAEFCGGNAYLSLFDITYYVPPSSPQNVQNYVYQGCYHESLSGGRLLSGPSYVDPNGMTVESCVSFCYGQDPPQYWAGLEYAQECYCANVLPAAAFQEPDEACDFLCKGDQKEFCGAASLLDVYFYEPEVEVSDRRRI